MRPFLVALLLALAVPAHGAATIVQCKTSGGSQSACADGSIQTAKLVDAANFVTLTGTQVLTNKTISGSANTLTNIGNGALTNSSLTLNGGGGVTISNATLALGGSYLLGVDTAVLATLAGTQTFTGAKTFSAATLGGNLAAGGFKVTGLGSPTAASSDAATASYAEAQNKGSAVQLAIMSSTGGYSNWFGSNYIGVDALSGANATTVPCVPWRAPANGTLSDMGVQGLIATSGATTITAYKSAKGTPSYSATAVSISVANGDYEGVTATTLAVLKGDIVCWHNDSGSWLTGGLTITATFTKT